MARTQTLWDRVAAIDPRILDRLLVLALIAVEVAVISGDPSGPDSRDDGLALLTLLVTTLPLAWRRRAPLAVLGVVAAALAVAAATGFASSAALSLSLAAYTAAAFRPADLRLAGALALAAVAGAALGGGADADAGAALVGAALRVGVPTALGFVVADRRRWIARDRAAAAQAAVADERARIARELHDVVMHTLGIMVVQAGAARSVLHRDPDAAAAALRQVEDAGRTGVGEMRRLLEVSDDEAARSPQPGLDRLDELVERFRAAGLPVDVVVDGEPGALPPGVDLSAYRIVQEALTNTLRHAPGARARVRLGYGADRLEVEVTDDGAGTPAPVVPADGGGRGLVGMRERVALLGGELRTGPRDGGGYAVRARLPREATR